MLSQFLLAQVATPDLWKIAAEHGFSASLVIVLLFGMREQWREYRKEQARQRESAERAARLQVITMLHMATLQPGVREQLTLLKDDYQKALGETEEHQ